VNHFSVVVVEQRDDPPTVYDTVRLSSPVLPSQTNCDLLTQTIPSPWCYCCQLSTALSETASARMQSIPDSVN
jgi:hypothetical protein